MVSRRLSMAAVSVNWSVGHFQTSDFPSLYSLVVATTEITEKLPITSVDVESCKSYWRIGDQQQGNCTAKQHTRGIPPNKLCKFTLK